jgi:hypothetical protein
LLKSTHFNKRTRKLIKHLVGRVLPSQHLDGLSGSLPWLTIGRYMLAIVASLPDAGRDRAYRVKRGLEVIDTFRANAGRHTGHVFSRGRYRGCGGGLVKHVPACCQLDALVGGQHRANRAFDVFQPVPAPGAMLSGVGVSNAAVMSSVAGNLKGDIAA